MIIKKIEIKDKKVNIILDDLSSFEIRLETYLNNEILLDANIDDNKIEMLKKEDNVNQVKGLLIKKISQKRLSKKECFLFLIENNIEVKESQSIVEELEKMFLINDIELAEIIVNTLVFNKKGINKIKEKLNERLIYLDYDSVIEKFIDKEKYESNIHYQLDKYFKLGSKKSCNDLKKYLCQKMIDCGYRKEEFISFIDSYEVDEYSLIKTEINKFFKKNQINKENIAKITKKLLSKGFNYGIIKDVVRECVNDEIN